MMTPEQVDDLWQEFCDCFPQIASAHNLVTRFAYLAGYRAALEHCRPSAGLASAQQAFADALYRTAIAIHERKRPHLDRGEIIGHGPN